MKMTSHLTRLPRRSWVNIDETPSALKFIPATFRPPLVATTLRLPLRGDSQSGKYAPHISAPTQLHAFQQRWIPGIPTYDPPATSVSVSAVLDNLPNISAFTSKHPHSRILGVDGRSVEEDFTAVMRRVVRAARALAPFGTKVLGFERREYKSPYKYRWRDLAEKQNTWVAVPHSHLGFALEKAAWEAARVDIIVDRGAPFLHGWPIARAINHNEQDVYQYSIDLRVAQRKNIPKQLRVDKNGHAWRLSRQETLEELRCLHIDMVQFYGVRFSSEPVCPECLALFPPGQSADIQRLASTARPSHRIDPLAFAQRTWHNRAVLLTQVGIDIAINGANLCYDGARVPARTARNSPSFRCRPQAADALLKKFHVKGVTSNWVANLPQGLLHVNPLALVPKGDGWRLVRHNSFITSKAQNGLDVIQLTKALPSLNQGEPLMASPLDGVARLVRKLTHMVVKYPLQQYGITVADIGGAFYTIAVRTQDLMLQGLRVERNPLKPKNKRPHWSVMTRCDMGSRASVTKWGCISYAIKEGLNYECPGPMQERYHVYVDDYGALGLSSDNAEYKKSLVSKLSALGVDVPIRKQQSGLQGDLIGVSVDFRRSSEGIVLLRSRPEKDSKLISLLPTDTSCQKKRWRPSLADIRSIFMGLQWRAQFWPALVPHLRIWRELLLWFERQIARSSIWSDTTRLTLQGAGSRDDIAKGMTPFHTAARVRASSIWILSALSKWKGTDFVAYILPRASISLDSDGGECGFAFAVTGATGRATSLARTWGAAALPVDKKFIFVPKGKSRPASASLEWFSILLAVEALISAGLHSARVAVRLDCQTAVAGAANYSGVVEKTFFLMGEVLHLASTASLDIHLSHVERTDPGIKLVDAAGRGDEGALKKLKNETNLQSAISTSSVEKRLQSLFQVQNGVREHK